MLQKNNAYTEQTEIAMDTLVTIRIVSSQPKALIEERFIRAFAIFRYIENICSRFTSDSEVMRLTHQIGSPVPVSPVLFEALSFALEVAKVTHGDFDPTIGQKMEAYGFNRHYLSREEIRSNIDASTRVSYQDIILDANHSTVILNKPLVLDLGAVVKGLAVDLAAKELEPFEGFSINAGGDLYVRGINHEGKPWQIGIEHPLKENELLGVLQLTEGAVCTSSPFKRQSLLQKGQAHLIQPKTELSPKELISTTVVAPFAMLADSFSTAVFIQGFEKGFSLLENEGLDGLLVTPDLTIKQTEGMSQYDFHPFNS